jgi:hypothetical protein
MGRAGPRHHTYIIFPHPCAVFNILSRRDFASPPRALPDLRRYHLMDRVSVSSLSERNSIELYELTVSLLDFDWRYMPDHNARVSFDQETLLLARDLL